MHQRTWLSILTFPLVATFTYPVMFHQAQPPAQTEVQKGSQDPLAGLSDIQDVLTLVRDNYVDPPDMEKVIGGGIQAALERAHPLNAYLTPEELRLPDPGPAQVGIVVVKRGIWAQVVAVTPGGPAAKAGVQAGDVIRKLDGDSVGALSAWALERKLRGPVGSEVSLVHYVNLNGQLKKVNLKRELLKRASISLRKDAKGTLVGMPDLSAGRAAELKGLLADVDRKLPLVLDLRECADGDLSEAALVAGLLGVDGTLATVQESGKPDRAIPVTSAGPLAFSRMAVLQGISTFGAGEALVSFMRKQSVLTLGERTAGLGVERGRILLRQGGAVELVNKRWLGAGGEKLDRQGVMPEYSLKGVQPEEDILAKVLEILETKAKKVASVRSAGGHPHTLFRNYWADDEEVA